MKIMQYKNYSYIISHSKLKAVILMLTEIMNIKIVYSTHYTMKKAYKMGENIAKILAMVSF